MKLLLIPFRSSQQWPKRTRSSYEIANFSNATDTISNKIITIANRFSSYSNTTTTSTSTLPTINTNDTINLTQYNNNVTTKNFSKPVILNVNNINHNMMINETDDDALIAAQRNASRHLLNPPKIISEAAGVVLRRRNGTTTISSNSNATTFIETTTKPTFFQSIMTTLGLNVCPEMPPNLEGPIEVNTTFERITILEHRLAPLLLPGGAYKPKECNARDRVAIIIPYRDRPQHLPIFFGIIYISRRIIIKLVI